MEIKKGDAVVIIAGKDKNVHGVVLSTIPSENRIVVDGVNVMTKHQRARKANEKSGIVTRPAPIDASNAMIVCPLCNKPTRIAHKVDENGKKARFCKHCQGNIDASKTKAKSTVKKAKKASTAKKKAEVAPATDAE